MWIWIFTKCLSFVSIGAFFIFWFFSVFEGIFLAATHSESFLPIKIAATITFIIVPVFFISGLINCSFLQSTYVYYYQSALYLSGGNSPKNRAYHLLPKDYGCRDEPEYFRESPGNFEPQAFYSRYRERTGFFFRGDQG